MGVSLPGRVDRDGRLHLRAEPPMGPRDHPGDDRSSDRAARRRRERRQRLRAGGALVRTASRKPIRNLIAVTISEGIGVGLLMNGQLVRGGDARAGEFGHVTLDENGPRCPCGKRGCWERYASNSAALQSQYRDRGRGGPATEGAAVRFEQLVRAARDGDRHAVNAIDAMATHLGIGLAGIITSLSPEVVVISVNLTAAWERFGPIVADDGEAAVAADGHAHRADQSGAAAAAPRRGRRWSCSNISARPASPSGPSPQSRYPDTGGCPDRIDNCVRLCLAATPSSVLPRCAGRLRPARPAWPGLRLVRGSRSSSIARGCFADFLREEVTFVGLRARSQRGRRPRAHHVGRRPASGGRESRWPSSGGRPSPGRSHAAGRHGRADAEDVIRRQLANALRVGLLNYLVGRPASRPDLAVTVRLGPRPARAGPIDVEPLGVQPRGSAAFAGEESSRQAQLGGSVSADRIRRSGRSTFGSEFDHETEEFDLDEDEPVKVERRERDFNWLVVKALGEHWSIGATGDVESSTFDNIELSVSAAPAVEFNVFPYSAYTRRQLRALYAIGAQHDAVRRADAVSENRGNAAGARAVADVRAARAMGHAPGPRRVVAVSARPREDAIRGRGGHVGARDARAVGRAELNASRIRDQLSLPARGASQEEILLRMRQLQSGYEYQVGMSLTYSFGSIFSSIVNPRFGSSPSQHAERPKGVPAAGRPARPSISKCAGPGAGSRAAIAVHVPLLRHQIDRLGEALVRRAARSAQEVEPPEDVVV